MFQILVVDYQDINQGVCHIEVMHAFYRNE
jgi:hypothetical protein